jgi:hypothetical protein
MTERSGTWSDSFIVNLGTEEGEGVEVPPKKLEGWHVDGRSNLSLKAWTQFDVRERKEGGTTWLTFDTHRRFLHPLPRLPRTRTSRDPPVHRYHPQWWRDLDLH